MTDIAIHLHRPGNAAGRAPRESREFRALYAATFALFLPVALVSRMLPRRWRPFAAPGRRSIVAEARAAAGTVVPFVFMA